MPRRSCAWAQRGYGHGYGDADTSLPTRRRSGVVDNVLSFAKFQQEKQLKTTDGHKRQRITGITKLEDANNAGTRKGRECTLILTEGDSAKALAVSGLTEVGRDNYGVFPLRGKLLNVREAGHDAIMKNVEITHIKTIMGLQHGKTYQSVDSLRYGRLMIMTDQDFDGSHIKGLIINFLDHFFPSLLKLPNFLVEFITPIVKCTKGKQEKSFFTIPEYEQWKSENNDGRGWVIKYFKGLGTSTAQDAKKYFRAMGTHMLPFETTQEGDRELIDLAFNKKKADDRKEWLRKFRPGTYLDHNIDKVPLSDFINKVSECAARVARTLADIFSRPRRNSSSSPWPTTSARSPRWSTVSSLASARSCSAASSASSRMRSRSFSSPVTSLSTRPTTTATRA